MTDSDSLFIYFFNNSTDGPAVVEMGQKWASLVIFSFIIGISYLSQSGGVTWSSSFDLIHNTYTSFGINANWMTLNSVPFDFECSNYDKFSFKF